MRVPVLRPVVGADNAFRRQVFACFIPAVPAGFQNVKAAVSKLGVNRFGKVMTLLAFAGSCLRALAELAILSLFQNRCMVSFVVGFIFRIVKIKEKIVVAGVKEIYVFVKAVCVLAVNAVERPAGLAHAFR